MAADRCPNRNAKLTGHARSYVGADMRFVDRDIDRASPTIFELAKPSIGALSVIGRGLRRRERIGQSPAFIARAAATHFRGNVRGWLAIDRLVGEEAAFRLRKQRARFAFIALTGIDKTSHAEGHDAPLVGDAMRIRIESNDTASRGFSNSVYTPSKVVTSSDADRQDRHTNGLVLRLDQFDVEPQTLELFDQDVKRLGQPRL